MSVNRGRKCVQHQLYTAPRRTTSDQELTQVCSRILLFSFQIVFEMTAGSSDPLVLFSVYPLRAGFFLGSIVIVHERLDQVATE